MASSRIDFRFQMKSGHAAHITAMTVRSTSVIAVMSAARPLFPQEQTFGGTPRTAVSCQTRTSADYSITFVGERE
jgi:hypothetical protein